MSCTDISYFAEILFIFLSRKGNEEMTGRRKGWMRVCVGCGGEGVFAVILFMAQHWFLQVSPSFFPIFPSLAPAIVVMILAA